MVGSLGVRVAGPSVSTPWRAKRGSGGSGLVTRVLTQNQNPLLVCRKKEMEVGGPHGPLGILAADQTVTFCLSERMLRLR